MKKTTSTKTKQSYLTKQGKVIELTEEEFNNLIGNAGLTKINKVNK